MPVDPRRLDRARRLHRVQEQITRLQEHRYALLSSREAAEAAEEQQIVAGLAGDDAFGPAASALPRRLQALARLKVDTAAALEAQTPRVLEAKGRRTMTQNRLSTLESATEDEAQRAMLIEILETRLARSRKTSTQGAGAWRSTSTRT
jgi:hypothetical protein